MKIYIIGTSNSVMRDGWVYGMQAHQDIEVVSLSVGRVPCTMHIATILLNKEEIKKSDLVILDHSVNDINVYIPEQNEIYLNVIYDLMSLVSSLGVPVLNMFFPILNFNKEKALFIEKIKLSCISNGIYYIDFHCYKLNKEYYKDNLHLKKEVAFFIGRELSHLVMIYPFQKNENKIIDFPYRLLTYKDILKEKNYCDIEVSTFANSLGTYNYCTLNEKIDLSRFSNYDLISIGYFNENSKTHVFEINSNTKKISYCTSGEMFSVELFDSPISIDKNTVIKKSEAKLIDIPVLMGRENDKKFEMNSVNITYLVFKKTNYDFFKKLKPKLKPKFKDNLDLTKSIETSINLFDKLFYYPDHNKPYYKDKDAKILRDIALKYESKESISLEDAYELMSLAHKARPKGSYIKNKLIKIKNKLQINKEG